MVGLGAPKLLNLFFRKARKADIKISQDLFPHRLTDKLITDLVGINNF